MSNIQRIIGLVIVWGIVILWAAWAFATTIILPNPDQFVSQADVIVTGKVLNITSFDTDEGIKTQIDIGVSDSIKGSNDRMITVREIGGKVGDKVEWIAGSPEYRLGEKVTVLLKRQSDGSLRTLLLDNGRLPETPVGINALSISNPYKTAVQDAIIHKRKEYRAESNIKSFMMVPQPAPLSGPAESLTEFRFMTDPPSRWFDKPVTVFGDPVGDKKYGPVESRKSVQDATKSWSSAGDVTFQYSGDTPAVGYTCVPGKLLVQFGDVKNDITDPVQCSGVLAIGGFCGGAMRNGVYSIAAGAVVFNNGWENCSFWNPDNITEVMTHEFGHAIGLSHSVEQGQPSTPYLSDAMMNWSAHFDGRRNGIKDYDRGAIVALYGPSGNPTPTPVPTATPSPTPTVAATPTPRPTQTPVATQTSASPFYNLSSLMMKSVTGKTTKGYVSFKVVATEMILPDKPYVVIFSNDTRKSILLENPVNLQLNKNTLTFRMDNLPAGIVSEHTAVAVITGKRIAYKDLTCVQKADKLTTTYNCQ